MSSYRLRSTRLQEAAAAREDHTNYAISKRTGLDQTTLSRACRGLIKPSVETLIALATTYGLSVDELIDRDTDEQTKVESAAPAEENGDAPGVEPGAPVEHAIAPTSK